MDRYNYSHTGHERGCHGATFSVFVGWNVKAGGNLCTVGNGWRFGPKNCHKGELFCSVLAGKY